MPASPYNVFINILGSVNPSVTRSITQVNRQLTTLQATVVATNRAIAGGFGRLLGLGAGLAGIGSVVAGMKQAVDLASQNQQIQEATLVILKNQRELRHESSMLAIQDLQTLNDQAVSLQRQTGLYKNIFEQGTMTLAQSKLNVGQIKSLQNSIANLLVAQRMQGKGAEQLGETYKVVGQAIEKGMGRGLGRMGVLLTPVEQRFMMMNATVGNIAGNIAIVEGAINRVYGGMAKMRMDTLTGRTEAHLADMRLSLENIGKVLWPIVQRLTGIFAQLISIIEPAVTRLATFIGDALKNHMKDIDAWMDLIKQQGIPLMIDWINKGWKKIQEFVVWFKQNQDWLIPWIKNIVIMTGVITALGVAAAGLAIVFNNALLVSIVAVGAAIWAAITNFHEFKVMMRGMEEWLVGTKRLDPFNKGFGYMRAFKKGVVPRAQPVQQGWLFDIVDKVNEWMNNFLDKTLPEWWKKISQFVMRMIGDIWKDIQSWAVSATDWIQTQTSIIVDQIEGAFQSIWNAMIKYLTGPLKDLSELWQKFLSTIFPQRGTPEAIEAEREAAREAGALPGGKGGRGSPPYKGTGGMLGGERVTTAAGGPKHQAAYPGAVRIMSEWVPGEPRTRATQYGAAGTHLQLGDVAMSEALMRQMGLKLRDYVDILDKSGRVVLAHQHIMDTSWFNNPTRDTHGVELWGRPDMGWGSVRPSIGAGEYAAMQLGGVVRRPTRALLGEAGPEAVVPLNRAGLGGVTINYSVTNHIHGGEDLEHRMAAIHRRHLDQLHRDLEEVTYRRNRSAFDGARAV